MGAACSAASSAPSASDAATDTPFTDASTRIPPLDNALCRRLVSSIARRPVDVLWLVEVMGLPQPSYARSCDGSALSYCPLYSGGLPPRDARVWTFEGSRVSPGWSMRLEFPDSIVDAPIGRVYRLGTDLRVVGLDIDPRNLRLSGGPLEPSRSAVPPIVGELTVTVVARDPTNTTPIPVLRLDALLCESGDVVAFYSRNSLFRTLDWPRDP